jgi:hypothetical protein
MAKYHGKIVNGRFHYTRPDLLGKLAAKHEGHWFEHTIEFLAMGKAPKSPEQLGFYWGLLVPEITKELNAQGHTNTVQFKEFTREVPYSEKTTHELLTAICGQVGDDGADTRLSVADKYAATRFIDNVLQFAVVELGMNEEKLKAWRDKECQTLTT